MFAQFERALARKREGGKALRPAENSSGARRGDPHLVGERGQHSENREAAWRRDHHRAAAEESPRRGRADGGVRELGRATAAAPRASPRSARSMKTEASLASARSTPSAVAGVTDKSD